MSRLPMFPAPPVSPQAGVARSPAPPPSPVAAGSPARQVVAPAAGLGLKSPPPGPESAPRPGGGLHGCDTELVASRAHPVRSRTCDATPAAPFSARCECGHPIGGWSCAACLDPASRGCLTCWQDGSPVRLTRHVCEVTLVSLAASGMPP